MHSPDRLVFLSTALFFASFALRTFVDTYTMPFSQAELLVWVSWILGVGGIVLFLFGLIAHRK